MDTIEERLKAARKKAGLTQAEAGAALNITRTAIQNYERESSRLNIHKLEKLAQLYGVSSAWLLSGVHLEQDNEQILELEQSLKTARYAIEKFTEIFKNV